MKIMSMIMSTIAITGVSVLLFNGVMASDAGKRYDNEERYEKSERYREREEYEYARELKNKGEILPLQDIITRATKRHPGKVIESELERESGGYIYEVEVLDADGKVWEMKYDAVSGEMLKDERDD